MRIVLILPQPSPSHFATLLRQQAGPDGEIHAGLLTVGDYMGHTRTLRARVWRVGRQLRVLAEHDIDELEQLAETLLELNRDYAQAQYDLAQVNLKLQQREAQIVASSLIDPLTGVGNRRLLEQALASETSRAERIPTIYVLLADTLAELHAQLPQQLTRSLCEPTDPSDVVEFWFST